MKVRSITHFIMCTISFLGAQVSCLLPAQADCVHNRDWCGTVDSALSCRVTG